MNNRQLRYKKRHKHDNLPNRIRGFLTLLAAMVVFGTVLGLVGRTDQRTALWEKTIATCEGDTLTEQKGCLDLIDQVQRQKGVRVISDGTGRHWIEVGK